MASNKLGEKSKFLSIHNCLSCLNRFASISHSEEMYKNRSIGVLIDLIYNAIKIPSDIYRVCIVEYIAEIDTYIYDYIRCFGGLFRKDDTDNAKIKFLSLLDKVLTRRFSAAFRLFAAVIYHT